MSLDKILELLNNHAPRKQVYIPAIWLDKSVDDLTLVSYSEFIANQILQIKRAGSVNSINHENDWTRNARIYNVFIRLFTAFDHNQDGKLGDSRDDLTLNDQGIRETGTFLKTIALLPYLKSLGINTLHLLPITTIGRKGRKGDLGSPYAIKDPFKIDPLLADPIVEASVEDQYKALVEAAGLMGMRVVQEFIFRTAAIDSDLIERHPDWFYWLNNKTEYGPPKFPDSDLKAIKLIPKGKGQHIPPPPTYRKKFALPPNSEEHQLEVASAFADWPPDDLQPPWTDVTYLRLYHYDYAADNNFNYIAYNTIRFYDPKLATSKNINRPLWDEISGIIPHYQENFGIHGAMIDMGHALPPKLKSRIIEKARDKDENFAFWDENFENTQATKTEGYNAVIGGAWYNITKRNGFRKQVLDLEKKRPLPYFGTAETHNSPRYGTDNKMKKIASWVLFNLLPQAIPFLHNGFELNEELPVNTGLNFTQKDLDKLKDKPLALFNKTALHWTSKKHIIREIKKVQQLREIHPWIFDGEDLKILKTDNPRVIGFYKRNGDSKLMVLFNTNFYKHETIALKDDRLWSDILDGQKYYCNNKVKLEPGKVLLLL